MSEHFFIRCDNKFVRVDAKDIIYIEAFQNYIKIYTVTSAHMVLMSMRQIERELPSAGFCRVHRSFIVAIAHIDSFDSDTIYLKNTTLPVSPMYKSDFMAKVKLLLSDTRYRMQN